MCRIDPEYVSVHMFMCIELAIIATIFAQRSEAGAPVCNGPAE